MTLMALNRKLGKCQEMPIFCRHNRNFLAWRGAINSTFQPFRKVEEQTNESAEHVSTVIGHSSENVIYKH